MPLAPPQVTTELFHPALKWCYRPTAVNHSHELAAAEADVRGSMMGLGAIVSS